MGSMSQTIQQDQRQVIGDGSFGIAPVNLDRAKNTTFISPNSSNLQLDKESSYSYVNQFAPEVKAAMMEAMSMATTTASKALETVNATNKSLSDNLLAAGALTQSTAAKAFDNTAAVTSALSQKLSATELGSADIFPRVALIIAGAAAIYYISRIFLR